MITEREVFQAAENYDSFYLYEEEGIRQRIRTLTGKFPGVSFLYSVKCNPNPEILKTIAGQGLGADAASKAEVLKSLDAGIPAEDIYYSSPGKTDRDLEETLGKCTLIADSVREVERIAAIAGKTGTKAKIGVRIHSNVSFTGGKSGASKFGIDEDQFFLHLPEWKNREGIRICGIHVHLRSQDLDTERIAAYHRSVLELAKRVQEELGEPLEFMNLGAGIGIPYALSDQEVNVDRLAENLQASLGNSFSGTRILIETGRYLVGKNGWYAMKVIDKKISHGTTYVILHSTLNGFLRPSLAQLIRTYAREEHPAGSEPLFTKTDAFQFTAFTREPRTEQECVDLVGNLCTATDVIAEKITLPRLEPGDVVVVNNAGSYAATLSPFAFASLGRPAEIMIR